MAEDLRGRVAIVTGASSGMGAAIVERLVSAGVTCHGVSRRGPVRIDISDPEAVAAFVDTLDRLDILVCAAGDNVKGRRLEQLTADVWNRMVAVNLSGAFYFVQAALNKLRASRGHVLFISSVSAQWPDGSGPAYQASKAGLTALARAAEFEEHPAGIRFSVLHPGLTNTPLMAKRPVRPSGNVVNAMLTPEDIADACFFILATPHRVHIAEMTVLPTRLQALGMTAVANPEPIPE